MKKLIGKMPGKKGLFDKTKSCYGCPDRWVKDGTSCHGSCEAYLARKRKHEQELAEQRRQKDEQRGADDFMLSSIRRCNRRLGRKR